MEKEKKKEYTHALLLFLLGNPANITFDLETLSKKCEQNKSRQQQQKRLL